MTTNLQEIRQQGWQGKLNLTYANQQGITQLIQSAQQAPLKVQRAFYPEGKEVCHSVILHTAGGIVGGDQLSLAIDLQSNAKALITTAAAGKIYRSNGLQAHQSLEFKVAEKACLEWLPQESILFNGAIYRQDLKIDLAPAASVILWEITRFGRSARGEKFVTGSWRSHTEIWQQNCPLWIDRQFLQGDREMLESSYCLSGHPVLASLLWIGQPVTPDLVEQVRLLWDTQRRGEAGVTRLTQGLLCRYRGNSTTEARRWFISVWHYLRASFWQRSCCFPRVWPQ